jgi:RimJ/RimL family protein N-acetyltransferase
MSAPDDLPPPTARLNLRRLQQGDAPFILKLLNDPGWLRYIGDRGVRSLDDAVGFMVRGPLRMYAEHGFGLWLVEDRASGEAAGLCGLLRREGLDDPDIGFAFLPEFRGRGFALEASQAVLRHAHDTLGFARVLAITVPTNLPSRRVLERLGLRYERTVQLPNGEVELALYSLWLPVKRPLPTGSA